MKCGFVVENPFSPMSNSGLLPISRHRTAKGPDGGGFTARRQGNFIAGPNLELAAFACDAL